MEASPHRRRAGADETRRPLYEGVDPRSASGNAALRPPPDGRSARFRDRQRIHRPYQRLECQAGRPRSDRMRVSTLDQHPETQLYALRQMAGQRGFEIVNEYTARISGAKARRPGLDQMMTDARRGRFDVVLVWASDRIARSVKHFLEVLDEL